MMLSFKNYMTDRGRYLQLGEMARDLSRHTRDPEGFLLRFTEARFPHLYVPLIESMYMEQPADAPPPPPADAAGATGAASGERPGARPAEEVAKGGGIISWLSDLFGGGGAKKNFEKALTSLVRVNGVLQTVRVPPTAQEEGMPAAGYDKFRDELKEVLGKLSGMKDQVGNLNVADAIKKDPSYMQELENDPTIQQMVATDTAERQAARQPAATNQPDPAHNNDLVDPDEVAQHIAQATSNTGEHAAEINQILADPANNTGDKARDDKAKHEKVAALLAQKNRQNYNNQGTPASEHRRRRNDRAVNESFSEAMVLAGVPARRKA